MAIELNTSSSSSSPYSSSPSSSSVVQWKVDVFVSFRGKDVRKNFASHLFTALGDAGLCYFIDNSMENIGEGIQSKLLKAIRHARFNLIVFSTNYADSKWCLDELVEILDCQRRFKNRGHVVVPIFFNVDPGHVSNPTGDSGFAQGFRRLCRSKSFGEAKIERWKSALAEAKHLTGLDLRNDANGNESDLVKKIVGFLRHKLSPRKSLNFVNDAIGLDSFADDVISMMKSKGEGGLDVHVIGICGVEGIGKTMAAGVICDRTLDEFDSFIFLENIGEANHDKLLALQKKLLRNLTNVEGSNRHEDIQCNISVIKSNMYRKKILLVLDNVTKREEMVYFGADERGSFCPGSQILITMRNPNLAKALKVDVVCMAKGLSPKASLQLFCRHVLQRDNPREGYEELCMNLVHYAGGHPLALKKFGSFLCDCDIPRDKCLKTLEKLVRYPNLDAIYEGIYGLVSSSYHFTDLYGGAGGRAFDDGRYTGVRQVSVNVLLNYCIHSITIDYDLDGCLVRSLEHGSTKDGTHCGNGTKNFTVKLDYPSEYLTSMSGHIREAGHIVIRSLVIQSNRRTYGPFVGSEGGRNFSFPPVDGGKIYGFHGRSGWFLDSIGARFEPISRPYPFQVVGPFGGHHGSDIWSDGKYTDVRQIVIGFDSSIRSFSVVYDKDGRPVGPFAHGSNDGSRTYTIKLDHPNEYIKSMSGCIQQVSRLTILRSLTIHTSRKDHGPFGTVEGRHFAFPYTGGKIIGFHGRCNGPLLESIGAFYEQIPHTYPIKNLGPLGGGGGTCPFDWTCTDIKRITIRYGLVIDSISFDYVDSYGFFQSIRHGGNGGENYYEINLKLGEYITSISGHVNRRMGPECISSLLFQTNKRVWGPIGNPGGKYFALPSNMGKIVGFFGTAGRFLDSIGAHMELYSNKLYPFKSVGLFGGSGGLPWDDGKHANVREIVIVIETSGEPVIESITYSGNGKEVRLPERHGSPSEGDVHTIKLDGSGNEYLTSISGYIRHTSSGSTVIGSLSFQSNRRTFGPYGEEHGDYFSVPSTGGKIIGFYGMSSVDHLDAIGAYFEPIFDFYPSKSIGPFGADFEPISDPYPSKSISLFGGPSGNAWDDGKHEGIMELWVWHNYSICSILVTYDQNGESFMAPPRGTSRGNPSKVILDYPREYLTSISGYTREDISPVINSLTLWTNRGRYGPFGKETGRFFWYPSTNSKIIGFYGRSSQFLESIGVYTAPISYLYPFGSIGPFGGSHGDAWDDGVHTDVRGFKVTVGSAINSITIEYDNNGSLVQCSGHGEEDHERNEIHEVKLDYPKEYLISLSGHIREIGYSSETVVQSLMIQTNKCFYGPFGAKLGKAFSMSSLGGGRIIGFHGKSGSHLSSIGAHLEPY